MNDAELLDLAEMLTRRANKPAPVSLERLVGGKNNRVYRLSLMGGEEAALKLYYVHPRDPRDRLGAEWSFLTYLQDRQVQQAPVPLAYDRARNAGLYSFVKGRRLLAAEIDACALAKASEFIAAINRPPHEPDRLEPSSEACFSIQDHLSTVNSRVSRLSRLDNTAPLASEAAELVSRRLKPLWLDVRSAIVDSAQRAQVSMERPISKVCVSPSDFGFHNALVDDGDRIVFIDFEYAGRDDPAKLVCDFFCQPEVPVPIDYISSFWGAVADPLALDESDLWRCRTLLPAYRIKWVCIILNEFLDVGADRRSFADEGNRPQRAARQLACATHYLNLIGI